MDTVKKTMKVAGIDPGLAATGIGIVRGRGIRVEGYAFGDIRTDSKSPLPERLDLIYEGVIKILETEKPDLMVVEDCFFLERYPKSGILLGKVSGVILLAGFRMKVPCMEVPVREAKKVLTGSGNAGKKQLERAVRHLLRHPHPISPYHASDAMALALIGLFRCP